MRPKRRKRPIICKGFFPDFDRARIYLYNVLEVEPDDEEACALLRKVNQEALSCLERFSQWEFSSEKRMENLELGWRLSRAEADRALSDGDVVLAFRKVWELITKYLMVFPESAATHLNWLTSQIVRILEQGELPAEIEALRDEMLKWTH